VTNDYEGNGLGPTKTVDLLGRAISFLRQEELPSVYRKRICAK
jgi:hypothetical protein